jgi:hypothetical protein
MMGSYLPLSGRDVVTPPPEWHPASRKLARQETNVLPDVVFDEAGTSNALDAGSRFPRACAQPALTGSKRAR